MAHAFGDLSFLWASLGHDGEQSVGGTDKGPEELFTAGGGWHRWVKTGLKLP